MILKRFFHLLFILLLLTGSAEMLLAQPAATAPAKPKRPKVGLVMSGGGAKGFAYIGLLKVLQEVGLEVDYIGGTSIGSIIAGFYAMGYSPDSMLAYIRAQNWDNVITDKIDRKYIAYEEKVFGDNYILSLPISKKKISIQASMYEGQEVNLLLNHYFSAAYKKRNFDQLQTPFVCVATDLITGEAVPLKSGYLPQAIRASMSIPGYFSTVKYDDRYLVDGGVVNNYPVDQVIKLGADFIVGLDVQQGLVKSINDLNTIPAVIDQLISFYRVKANEEGYKKTNLYINIPLKYKTMDFDSYDSIIAAGERVGREHYAELKALADSLNAIEFKPLKKYDSEPLDSIFIDNLIVEGNERVSNKYFENTFSKFEHSMVDIDELEKDIRLAYGTKYFSLISYEFRVNKNGGTDLIILVKESDPGYLAVGAHYNNDYSVGILLNGTFRNILGKNSKIFANLIIGPSVYFRGLYLKDNGSKPGFGAKIEIYSFGFDDYEGEDVIGRINFTNFKGSAFASSVIKNLFSFRLGGNYEYFRFKSKLKSEDIDSISNYNSYANLYFAFNSDTRDRSYLSTKGSVSELRVEYVTSLSKDWVKDFFSNSLVLWLDYNQNIPINKRWTFKTGVFLGGTYTKGIPASSDKPYLDFKRSPVQHWFYMGGLSSKNYVHGFREFTGVKFVQRYGEYQAILRAKFQYNFYKKLYLTVRGDVGAVEWYVKDIFDPANTVVGYGGTVSYDSFIGPVELTVMGSNIHSGVSFFINIGYWF